MTEAVSSPFPDTESVTTQSLHPVNPAPESQLWSLVFDPDGEAFHNYVKLEVKRLKKRQAGLHGRPEGLRLSIECPTLRVRAWWDERYLIELPEGPCERGFEMESRFMACVPTIIPEDHWQTPIKWSAGISAWDGGQASYDRIPVSLKSAVGKKHPSNDNRRQDERMLVAAGAIAGAAVDTYMLDPSWLTAYGPIRHTLSLERFNEITHELDANRKAMEYIALHSQSVSKRLDDPDWWHDLFGLTCSCGSCTTHHEAVDADHPLEKLAVTYEMMKLGADTAADRVDEIRQRLVDAATIRLRTNPGAKSVHTHFSPYAISRNKNGVWAIRVRKI